MQITKKDVFWNYAATFLKIASSAVLLPFILRTMPSETIGIWSVFITITAFSSLLDFGFGPSFTRNVTYVFSGIKTLQQKGIEFINPEAQDITVDYGLLKGVIKAMRWFYLRMALVLFITLATLGTYYIHTLLQNYKSNHQEVYIAWALLCIINTYNLFTLYYDALLQGKGLVKRSKQIVIIGQTVYLIIATILIVAHYGLIAIISAQASSVVIIRWLSYHAFFTSEIKQKLHTAISRTKKEIIKAIYPNALKIGLTSLGGFSVQRSAIVIGSLYLPLKDIASYGITMQIIAIIAGFAGIYTATFQPKIAQLRVAHNIKAIKAYYLRGQLVLLFTYIAGGIGLLLFGNWALNVIGSQTQFMPGTLMLAAIIISFLENNHAIAGGILLTNNEVPFFKASLIAGMTTIILLLIMLHFHTMGLWPMLLAPGIAHLYNNWKWPYEVVKQLNITLKDVVKSILEISKIITNER
jgi:O-antigen/teichoic acid export membrane protein